MDAQTLYEKLRKVQEPKGYFFNNDREKVMDLIEALLTNKDRYGYMACPCRLASAAKRAWCEAGLVRQPQYGRGTIISRPGVF